MLHCVSAVIVICYSVHVTLLLHFYMLIYILYTKANLKISCHHVMMVVKI